MARRSLGLATIVAGAVFLLALVFSVDAQYAELIRRLRKPAPVKISFTVSEYTVEESVGELSVCLEVDADLPAPTTVLISSYQTNDKDSASAYLDFDPVVRNLTLPPSDLPRLECMPHTRIHDDTLATEGNESFAISLEIIGQRLFGEYEYEVVTPITEIRVTILDNDNVTVEFTRNNLTVSEEEGTVEVCLSVTTPTASPILFIVQALETTPTSAQGGLDFTPVQMNIIIPPSNITDTTCFLVPILEDRLAFEGEEMFMVQILPPVEGIGVIEFGPNTTIAVYILDNDNVTLTVEIQERPQAVRPIIGETVVFSCEIRSSSGLVWQSPAFGPAGDIVFLRALHDVNNELANTNADAVATLTVESADALLSTLTFSNVTSVVLNGTEVYCVSADNSTIRNVEMVTLAGIPSPPINVTVQDRTCYCLNVTWTTPLYDGDAPLLHTQLQFNNTSNSSALVRNIQTESANVEYVEVCGLLPNIVYLGSVWAVNRVGRSEAVAVELLISESVPSAPTNFVAETTCSDPTLCVNGSLTFSWDPPPADLLCPVFSIHLNYSIIDLEVLIEATTVVLDINITSYRFPTVAPGRTSLGMVSFENEVGMSINNPTVREDILLFSSVQLLKLTNPSTIFEGDNALYSVRLNGPPPVGFSLDLNNLDDFTRVLTPQIFFNSTLWYQRRDIIVMATDDDIIRDSPYGAVVTMGTVSNRPLYNNKLINLSIVIQDTDRATIIITRKEAYPYPPDIPEGRWAVYLVSLPNRPTHPLNITYTTLTPTITLSPFIMTFDPDVWNVPQELTVIAIDDSINMATPYGSGFNLTLESEDKNYRGQRVPDYNVTIEDNDNDAAVASGTLTWKEVSEEFGRGAVLFTLSLALARSYYPTITPSDVGVKNISLPGNFELGNGNLTVVGIYGDYVLVSGQIVHRYHDYDDTFSMAEYEYCCRGESLINNARTLFSLRVDVDLTQPTSPTLPTLPRVILTPSQPLQPFFYTALHSNGHPLVYYLGNAVNYQSSQGGAPQWLEIEYSTGQVTWEPDHVTTGDYSVQVIVEDIFTGIKVASELIVSVTTPSTYTPPVIVTPSTPLTPPTHYTTPGSTLSTNITVYDANSILGLRLDPILPLPEGAWLNRSLIVGANSMIYEFQWEPTEEQVGEYLLCFVSRDGHGLSSTPGCLRVVITEEAVQQPSLSLTGNDDPVYRQNYTRGIDQSVSIASSNTTLTSPLPITHMYITIVNHRDGQNETIEATNQFSHPSLTFGRSVPQSPNTPPVVYLRGVATADVYLEALRNLVYVNNKPSPTVGERVITVTVHNGQSANHIAYTVVTVAIQNTEPVVQINGNDESYSNLFFPHEGPVAAVNPEAARILDSDSPLLQSLMLQLHNVRNGPNEILTVTYQSPETLSLPIIAEATQLSVPFGTLWRGEVVPSITSMIRVNEVGVVGQLSIIVDIRHSWVGDLRIELEHNGRRELIVLSPGGQTCPRDDIIRATFESQQTSSGVFLSRGNQSPGLCRFQSEGLFTADGELDNFRGDAIEGDWLLHVTDLLLENDNGRLFGWSVVIQPEEVHALISQPPVLPPIVVGGARGMVQERHEKEVQLDGRIVDISVHIQLGVDFLAEQAYLPTLTLVHPDSTRVVLSYWNIPFCAIGNYTNLVFSDRGQSSGYLCQNVLNPMSGSGSGSGMNLLPTNSNVTMDQIGSGMSGSGSGSGSGIPLNSNAYLDLDDIRNLNIPIANKHTQVDLLTPVQSLSALRGKRADGKWVLVVTSGNRLESTLYGWSIRIAREPNINPSFDSSTNTLTLSEEDSVANYQTVLRSIMYENTAAEPDFSVDRFITIVASDGELISNESMPSARSSITVHHIEIDLDPLNMTSALTPDYSVTFLEHSAPISILDSDNAILRDDFYNRGQYILTATLKGYQNLGEEGLILNTSVTTGLGAVFSNNTLQQELQVTVISADLQSIGKFESVLRTFEYFNNAEEFVGLNRTVEFMLTDVQMNSRFVSDVAVATITLEPTNDLPVLLLNSYRYSQSDQFSNIVAYVEGQGTIDLTNSTSIVLTDNDHDYLLSVAITITNPQDSFNEFLGANTTGTLITAEYNLTTYTLMLTGMASLSTYIDVLGTVTYENTMHSPGMPGTEPRQVIFVPYDGSHSGLPAVSLVTFAAVNDPAFGDLNGADSGTNYTTVFVEERGPVSIISENATFYDVDDISLAYIDVQITNIPDAPLEILSVTDVEETTVNGRVVELIVLKPITSYDPNTGSLRISGLDTVREYQEVLKTLTYNNLADEPTNINRQIIVTLNDSHSISLPLIINVGIELVNDSPYFNEFAPPTQHEIYEDIPDSANSGVTVLDVADLIIDDDLGALRGIAVIGLNTSFGDWQYTIDGLTWSSIAANVSINYALALEATLGVAIRFVPDMDWNGMVTLTIVAWDTTDGNTPENYIDAQSKSNTDAFSSNTSIVTITVEPVNDAPILPQISLNLTAILEDDYNSYGDSVLSLVQYVTDVDNPQEFGIAITNADQQNGEWQFTTNRGISWEGFGTVNESSTLLLQSLPEDLHRVRFVPEPDFNGLVTFDFVAWDLTRLPMEEMIGGSTMVGVVSGSGIMSGSGSGSAMFMGPANETTQPPYPSGTKFVDISMSDIITGPFSVSATSVTIVVEPVNDSPVIQTGMTLQNITEDVDPSINHGTTVADIIEGFYTDIDANPDRGLAVVQVDDRYGEWQYTCQSPSIGNWSTFIGDMVYGQIVPRLPQPERATLLLSTCWIRFLPNQFFNSELNTDGYPRAALPYIQAHGWDNTGPTSGQSGTFGNDATNASSSDINEFSSNAERITIQVISVNNVPILRLTNQTLTEYSTVYVEDRLPVYAVGRDLILIDNDHARLRDVTITIYGSEFDVSPFANLMFDSGSGSGLSGVGSGMSGSGSGMSGSGSGMSGSGNVMIPDDEYVSVISSTPSYPPLDRVQEYVRFLPNATDLELYCSGLTQRREELLVNVISPDLISEVISYCPFVLRLAANPMVSPDAHKDMFQLALRSLRYNNSIEEPMGGDRTLTFVVSDNVGLSVPVNSTVFVQLVNDAPQLDLNEFLSDVNNFVSYTEGQGPLLLSNETILRLIDHDNSYLQYARIVLFEAPDADHEILNATVEGTNINLEFNTSTYTLTLSGNDTLDTYRTVLSTVSYTNNYSHPGNPDERQREVQFFVSDGVAESMVAISYISFTGVNNRPYLDVNGNAMGVNYTTRFVEEQGAVSIVDPGVLVHDEDNTTLAYIRVQLVEVMEFMMEFLSVDNVTLTRILEESQLDTAQVSVVTTLVPEMTFDDVTGILTISGLDTLEEYQLVLSTIKYNNLANEPMPGCRPIQFTANDGDLDSVLVFTDICVEPFNDSPFFNTSVGSVYSPLILEDETNNDGVLVPMFAYQLFSDRDMQPMWSRPGVGIVYVETENGDWEYSIDGGNMWTMIRPDTNIESLSLLLSAEMNSDNLVRFIPDRDFHGNASLTFVLWDGSDGMSPGDTRSALSTSHTDPFSNDTHTMVLRIVPVNDAPVINATIEPQMTTIREDSVRERESLGDEVAVFLAPLVEDVDVSTADHHFGIAVTMVDESNGFWQISTSGGMNWTNISSPSPMSAVVLDSQPASQNRIRFVPDPDFNGEAWFQYKLWDRNVTWPSGTEGVNTATDPVTGTFSVGIATARLTIEPVNDSPRLSGDSNLDSIAEDIVPGANVGTFVNEILRFIFNDIDGADIPGLAVVGVDRRYGNWQYTCDLQGATSWIDFRGERLVFQTPNGVITQIAPRDPNVFKATLLSGEDNSLCRIRFVPSENYNTEFDLDGFPRARSDRPFIQIRGWDGTSGLSENEGVDTTSIPDDHTNAFGLETVLVYVDVTSVNDNPILRLNGEFPDYLSTYVEPIPPLRRIIPVPVVNPYELTLTDPDNSLINSVSVSFTIFDVENEMLLLNTSGTSLNYTITVLNETTSQSYVVQIIPFSGESAPVGEFEAVLRSLQYANSAEEPDNTTRVIRFAVNDGLGFTSARTELSIALLNDPPQLDLARNWPDSYRFVSYSEGQGALNIVGDNATLVDFDSPILELARVAIVMAPDMEHEILNATSNNSITVVQNGSEIILQGPASVVDFLDVVKTVTYENTLSNPGDPSPLTRTIQFTVNDGLNDSLPAFVYLSFSTINNAPFLDANGRQPGISYIVTFYEEQGPISILSPDTLLEDIDNTTLAYILVTILNPVDGDNEVLYVEDVTQTSAPVSTRQLMFFTFRAEQQYDSNTATLRLSGLDTMYEYQEILKTLKYNNLADEPKTDPRMIQFEISDGGVNTTGVYVTVEIELVNDSPYFNSSAIVFSPNLDEDVHPLLNPGWSIVEVVSNGLILDDDADSLQGIAIVSADVTNGYWEVTWDYTTNRNEFMVGSGSGSGSGMGSSSPDMMFNGLQPTSGSGFVSTIDGSGDMSDFNITFEGSGMSGSGSSSGSGIMSGSGVFGSGSGAGSGSGDTATEAPPTTPPPPKCRVTTPTNMSEIQETFYATWYRLPNTTSITMATVLRVHGNRTRIRFVPNRDFNGPTSFSIVAWDVTNNIEDGTITNATSSSPIDPYSLESVEILLNVLPVNDAPLLSNATVQLSTILEDDITSTGNDVSDFLFGVMDIDTRDTVFGIAIVEADETKGVWQFTTNGGRGWTTMMDVCPYNATVLSSEPAGQNRVRFIPNRDFNGQVSFSFVAWDQTSGEPSGTMSIDTTASDRVTGAYSNSQANATIIVEPVNDSPVLIPGSRLHPIFEDTSVSENNGTLVWDIVDGFYHDVDSQSARGIAVRGVDLRYGTWEWNCPSTNVWREFFGDFIFGVFVPPLPLPERATLLDGNCSIRFLPNVNFNTLRDTNGDLRPSSDFPYLSVVAWDTTVGNAGEYGVDTTSHNDSIINEYGAEVENVLVEVLSVNDLPQVNITQEGPGISYTTEYTEEQAFVKIIEPDFVFIADADHSRLDSVRIVVSNSIDPMTEQILFDNDALSNDSNVEVNSTTNTITVTTIDRDGLEITESIQVAYHVYSGQPDSPSSSLTLSAPPGRDRVNIAAYAYLLRFVVYLNLNPEPNNNTRVIRFYFDDSEDINSMVTTEVTILLLNDNAPVLSNSLTNVQFTEDSGQMLSIASDNLTLTDSDHNEYFYIINATLSLYPIPVSNLENVSVQISSNLNTYNITQLYSPDEGVLRVMGSAPVLVYESLLTSAVYQNSIEEPPDGMRIVTMQVFDGDNFSNVQRVAIDVVLINDQVPEIATSDVPFVFTERTQPVAISNGLIVSDADSGNFLLSRVSVTIDNPLDGLHEILAVRDFGAVNSTYNDTTLELVGPASVADFQATLSTLTYNNMAEEPSPMMRNITLVVYDQNFVSDPGLILVSIELVNDLPVIAIPPHELMVNYVEGSGAVFITTNATISDNDHTMIVQLTVLIGNPLDQPNEYLNVTIPPDANITSSYNPDSGLLILNGISGLSSYEATLRSLAYENLEANPGFPDTSARMIQLIAFDGSNYSFPVDLLLTFESVNDAPMLDLNGPSQGVNHTTSYVEEGEPVLLTTPDAILFDIDNTSLAYVRVRIENLLDGNNEILSVSSNSSEDLDPVFFTYQDGTLLIVGLGETTSFEEVLATITYRNLADEPNYATRVISFMANDGLLDSRTAYARVEMIPVNDPPRLYIAGGMRRTVLPTEMPTESSTVPTRSMSGDGVMSGSGSSGSGMVSGSGMSMSGSGSGMDNITMINPGSGSGMELTVPPTEIPQPTVDPDTILDNVTIQGGGDYSVIFIENSQPVAIIDTNGTLIEDDDHQVLVRFEAVLHSVQDPDFEAIFFDSDALSNELVASLFSSAPTMGGFLGNDMTCVAGSTMMKHVRIDINISLSILDWEEVVRSLRYCNGDEHPVSGARNVTFRIQDPALAWSDVQTTVVEVVPVNDAPICSTVPNLFTIDEDTNLTVTALRNCFDHEETLVPTSISVFTQPERGEVLLNMITGDLVFVPMLDDYGNRTFVYQACDSTNFCSNPQMVTVLINPVNDPPYPFQDLIISTPEDTLLIVPLSQFFGDVDDDLIPNNRYPRVVNIAGSTPANIGLEDDQNSTLMYMPFQDFFGTDNITLEVCDSVTACVNITIMVIVESVNDPPVIDIVYPEGMPPAQTVEDTELRVELMITEVEDRAAVNVTVVAVGNGVAIPESTAIRFELGTDRLLQDTTILYTPNQDFYGNDTVTIATIDSDGGYKEETIEVSVSYVNDPPFFGITELTIVEDMIRTWRLPHDLLVTDPENTLHAGSFEILQSPSLGNLTYNYTQSNTSTYPAYGTLTYYPPEHYFTPPDDPVTFVLRACDNDTIGPRLCTNATIQLIILSDNDAPHLPLLERTVCEDGADLNDCDSGVNIVNLMNHITDVEDGTPPLQSIFLIEPLPTRGEATYDPSTGYVTYVPRLNEYGADLVYYNACDSENHCSQMRGEIQITILEINDPPEIMSFMHISREDDFDLIFFTDQIYDNETTNLRIGIVSNDGSYQDEWTTSLGGRLRVYHAHQILTYQPPTEYVGPDSFRYAVCDNCDPRRDSELGRTDPDPECERQRESNNNNDLRDDGVNIQCVEAVVTIAVTNVNDVPTIGDIAGMAGTGITIHLTPFENSQVVSDLAAPDTPPYFYRNVSQPVLDYDDQQLYFALSTNLNFTLYNLETDSDINETSLILKSQPSNGNAVIDSVDGVPRIIYNSYSNFTGYDQFIYEVCDKQRSMFDEPRCAEGTARVWVNKAGPVIVSVEAISATTGGTNNLDTDSRLSTGDQFLITFSEPTNLPPYGNTFETLTYSDIISIFSFDSPFFISEITPDPLQGQWLSPTQLRLVVTDPGYPTPFIQNGEMFTEIMIGQWTIAASSTVGPCGGFDENGQLLTNLYPYCLQTADETSFHSTSVSPPLEGNFGLKLPDIANVVVRNTAVDDAVLNNQDKNLQVDSQISIHLKESLSYSQLQLLCQQPVGDIIDLSELGTEVEVQIVGCANILENGQNAEEVFADAIELIQQTFVQTVRRKRQAGTTPLERERRQASSPTSQPATSEIVIQINSLVNPTIDPNTDPQGFVRLISESINQRTLAEIVAQTQGIDVNLLLGDQSNTATQLDPFFYFEADNQLTPLISRVVAADPDNVDSMYGNGDTITILFDRSTDQPGVSTRLAIDMILIFDPPLGNDYRGEWISPSVLEITILDAGLAEGVQRPSTTNFSLAFTPNYFHTGQEVTAINPILPTDTPWCVGINVCGAQTTNGETVQSIGICNANQRSCRAYQRWTSLEGDFGTGVPVIGFPFYWIIIAILAIVVIVVIVIVVVLIYRYYKRKAERKEALRVVRRWRKEEFRPGVEPKKDGPKPWVKPPDMSAMRENPDPFSIFPSPKKLPEVVPRPATALTEVENLPPVPQQPFKPRGGASIRPSVGSLGAIPPLPRINRTLTGSSLPPTLGLPPLSKPPGIIPSAPEQRTTLPPLRGGALATQARRALGDTGLPPLVGSTMPGQLMPRSLPPIKLPQSPISPGAPPLSPFGKGKGPLNGRPVLKKTTPPTSSEEDISGSEMTGAGSGSALPTIQSPPFKTTRPLPPINLPPIGGSALPPIRSPSGRPSLSKAPIGMPSRRTSVDPFAADSATPGAAAVPTRRPTPAIPTTLTPLSRMVPKPLSRVPIPLLPGGGQPPPISPRIGGVTASMTTKVQSSTIIEEAEKESKVSDIEGKETTE